MLGDATKPPIGPTLPDSLVLFTRDANDLITHWSQGAADLYGFSARDAVGRRSHDLLNTMFPQSYASILADLEARGEWQGSLQHRTKSGRWLVVNSRWIVHRDAMGTLLYILEINQVAVDSPISARR